MAVTDGATQKEGIAIKGTAIKGTAIKGTAIKGTAIKGTAIKISELYRKCREFLVVPRALQWKVS